MSILARRAWLGLLVAAIAASVGLAVRAGDDPPEPIPGGEGATPSGFVRDSFESTPTAWSQELTDATMTLQEHDRSPRAAHDGRLSEHFRFNAGLGSAFFYSYRLPKIPVTEELKANLYVRANRAGVQLFVRVILPADADPDSKRPTFLLVPGTIFESTDRWQRLTVTDLKASVEQQARVLRASSKRPVSVEGAYVERLVVNLYTATGDTEVFLDELSVGPVPESIAAEAAAAQNGAKDVAQGEPEDTTPNARPADDGDSVSPARLDRNRLKRRGPDGLYHDWVMTAIRAPGADVAALRDAGFDVYAHDLDDDPRQAAEAVSRGFLLMPRIGRGPDGEVPEADEVVKAIEAYPHARDVMAWDLGDHLGRNPLKAPRREELEGVRSINSKFRSLPPAISRLTTGVVDDDLALFARAPQGLSFLGIRPPAWGGSYNMIDTLTFLKQRRDLTVRSNVGANYWAMLPAAPPPEFSDAVWGQDVPPSWGTPTVQPEQLRLMTYLALSSGYRGITYEANADLTRGPGRMLLLEMSLLNAEIDLCESIIANGSDPIPVYNAHKPDPPLITPGSNANTRPTKKKEEPPLPGIRAAAVGTLDRKGVLLFVGEYNGSFQYQPAQMARNDVNITVVVPETAQAMEISPGRTRWLEIKRGIQGKRITLEEFDTTALILVTTDLEMAKRVEAAVNSIRPRAVNMAIEQAELKLEWVREINARLALQGHYLIREKERKKRRDFAGAPPTDADDLMLKAAENIKAARENVERGQYDHAWSEARRASRAIRHLMRGLWDNASDELEEANTDPIDLANEDAIKTRRVKKVTPPSIIPTVACPPLSSFATILQSYVWTDLMKTGNFGRNLVPGGSFDDPDVLKESGWTNEGYQYDGIKATIRLEKHTEESTNRYLRVRVEPAKTGSIDSLRPFLDYPAAAVRSPSVKVKAGQFLKVTVWVKRALPTPSGPGVIVRDSIGGEPLQFSSPDGSTKFQRLILYRRAPAEGDFHVTFGLAGYGDALFDNFSIQRVEAPGTDASDLARLPSPAAPPTTPGTPPGPIEASPPRSARATTGGRTGR